MIKIFTEVEIPDFSRKLSLEDKVMVLGSCFADSMGERLLRHGYKAMINPFGTLYNPLSIEEAVRRLDSGDLFGPEDCVEMGAGAGLVCSFSHHTSFARKTAGEFLENANGKLREACRFWKEAEFVIVNYDSAFVWSCGDRVVANCLKRPACEFERRRIPAEECARVTSGLVAAHPDKRFIFSISPIRHPGADGAHASTLSKATLLLGLDDALSTAPEASYFPSYEILTDELRDYRFYADDLLHPSEKALDIIWEKFSKAALAAGEQQTAKENEKQWRRSQHIEKKR
ncbi:MAG: GSCFA domain-containing protein [Candidatus Cryptobacteroides sp.]